MELFSKQTHLPIFITLVLRVFDKFFKRKHIVHPYSSNSTLKSLTKYRIPHQGIASDDLLLFHPTYIRLMGLR